MGVPSKLTNLKNFRVCIYENYWFYPSKAQVGDIAITITHVGLFFQKNNMVENQGRFWWMAMGPHIIEQIPLLLTFGYHDPNLGLMTKAKAWKGADQKCNLGITFALLRMWKNQPTHFQLNSHIRSWNPYGVLNIQKGILGVKTYWIKEFFVPLEISRNVDV